MSVHRSAVLHDGLVMKAPARIEPFAVIGNPELVFPGPSALVRLGPNALVGHHSLIRGDVTIGENFKLGSYSSVEGTVTIGDDVTIRGRCEIPNSVIGDRVQIYAGTMFYDTPNPPDGPNLPPVLEDDVILCCDVRVLGGITIGKGSFVCAGAFVTQDVPRHSYVKRDGTAVPRR